MRTMLQLSPTADRWYRNRRVAALNSTRVVTTAEESVWLVSSTTCRSRNRKSSTRRDKGEPKYLRSTGSSLEFASAYTFVFSRRKLSTNSCGDIIRLTTKFSDRRAASVERSENVQVVHHRQSQSGAAVRCSALVSLHFLRVCHREPQSYTFDFARPTRRVPYAVRSGKHEMRPKRCASPNGQTHTPRLSSRRDKALDTASGLLPLSKSCRAGILRCQSRTEYHRPLHSTERASRRYAALPFRLLCASKDKHIIEFGDPCARRLTTKLSDGRRKRPVGCNHR
jgi:hypothetical protein